MLSGLMRYLEKIRKRMDGAHPPHHWRNIPSRRLSVRSAIGGIGSSGYFSADLALVAIEDITELLRFRVYAIDLHIAHFEAGNLPSLLRRTIMNRWRIDHGPTNDMLECTFRSANSIT